MEKTVKFKCQKCGTLEEIPKEVVDMIEGSDNGDKSVPPRFKCEKCPGLMEPLEYKTKSGIIYKYKE